MKNIIFSTLFLCLASLNAFAQNISAADQKGIDECYKNFMGAFDRMDLASIAPLLTEQSEQILPSGEILRGRDNIVKSMGGYMEYLKSMPKPDAFERSMDNAQTRYLGPGMVLSTYVDVITMQFGNQKREEKTTTAVILRKTGDKWLIDLIDLTSVSPMPIGK